MTKRDEEDNTNIILEGDNPVMNDEIALKAVDELLNLDKLKTISRIKIDQIPNITRLYLFSETFGSPFCKVLADNILQLQISLNGYGRRELVQLVQQRNGMLMDKPMTSKDIFK